MKKIIFTLNTSKKIAYIDFILNELFLLIGAFLSQKNNERTNMIYFLIAMILILVCFFSVIFFVKVNKKNVYDSKNKIVDIIWRGAAKFLVYNSLSMVAYVIFKLDVICVSIYIVSIVIIIVFVKINLFCKTKR